jgi:uncharacterized protein YprB with RNaseH-like and TPR domain
MYSFWQKSDEPEVLGLLLQYHNEDVMNLKVLRRKLASLDRFERR